MTSKWIFLSALLCVVQLIWAADKSVMKATVVVEKSEEKAPGYFTVDKDTVHITSLNGTIDLVLQRIGKDANGKERERDWEKEVSVHYPVKSKEWNDEFIDWMWRVRHVTDGGHVPTYEEWQKRQTPQ